jgi:hypothetical protein
MFLESKMKAVNLYGSVANGGDGSAYVMWFLDEEE